FVASAVRASAFPALGGCRGGASFCEAKCCASSFSSGLVSFSAIGVICGSLRKPSGNMKSEVARNCRGCPALDGTAGLVELPPSPWHATHRFGSAAKAAAQKKNAAVGGAGYQHPPI